MSPETRNVWRGIFWSVIIVTTACLAARTVRADGPSRADLQNLEDIKKNQKCVSKTRDTYTAVVSNVGNGQSVNPDAVDFYNDFVACKHWNKSEVEELNKNGWNVDWSTMQLVPIVKPEVRDHASVDIDKLAKAVALHETGDCTAKRGSALFLNCHGFRRNNKFLHFKSKNESYAYFETLWTKNYGGMPTVATATAYVCGWNHLRQNGAGTPCKGGNPKSWLADVTAKYNSL